MVRLSDGIEPLRTAFEAEASADAAVSMAAYMRGQFEFFGLTSPERRAITKPLIREAKKADPELVVSFAEACWAEPQREFRYVGTEILRANAKHLQADDLPRVRALIQADSWWDTIDPLAAWVVGPIVTNFPDLAYEMDDWIDDPDFWVARTAILHQLGYKDATNADRLFAYCDRRASDPEFFIRKALGWALRQYARVDPDAVAIYVAENDEELSGLTKREALKHIG